MALSFINNESDSISFDEFIEIVSRTIITRDENSLLNCLQPLFMLANNKNFFLNFLNEKLSTGINSFQINNVYGEQSYQLYECEEFFIRVTYWPLASKNVEKKNAQNQSFSYNFVHDHNFPLLTTGYKGEGYWTKLWEYDYEKVIGFSGEKVDIKFLEETSLSEKKAIYYRPSKDIHMQQPPRFEDSLAINIITPKSVYQSNRQYQFDIEKSAIKSLMHGGSSSILGLFDMLKNLHNEKTVDLLNSFSDKPQNPKLLRSCIETLHDITGDNNFLYKGIEGKDKANSEYFKLKLEGRII